jgi:hypothetical protein
VSEGVAPAELAPAAELVAEEIVDGVAADMGAEGVPVDLSADGIAAA